MTSPFAVWLLPVYTANVYMNAFFGILDGSVAFMVTTFSTILYDAVRLIEEHWESWIEAIESGQLPGVEGLGEYRVHLQVNHCASKCLPSLSQFTSTGTPQAKPRASGGAAFDQERRTGMAQASLAEPSYYKGGSQWTIFDATSQGNNQNSQC